MYYLKMNANLIFQSAARIICTKGFLHHALKPNSICTLRTLCVAAKAPPIIKTNKVKPIKLDKYMIYLPATNSTIKDNPMVVIYGFLMAKEKHYKRINDFYLNKGIDVLKVQITPRMQLWPMSIKPIILNMLEFLGDKEHNKKPLILHGFSVGGYMYCDTILHIIENPDKYGKIGDRIRGHISDSPVDIMGATTGISMAVTESIKLQKLIKKSLDKYLEIFYKQCTHHMLIASKLYKENPLRIPYLFLYSTTDPISNLEPIELSKQLQEKQRIPYFYHEFDTPHVSHLKHYPEKYKELLEKYLEYINIMNMDEKISVASL